MMDFGKSYYRCFEKPEKGENYIISADASSGGEDSNLAASSIIKMSDHSQVGAWSGNIDPDTFAEKLLTLGDMYNSALIAPEREKYGVIVINRLMKREYCNIYYHTIRSTGFKPRIETDFGWNPRNREEAIRRLQVDIMHGNLLVRDKSTIVELSNFVRDKKSGKYQAAYKKTDDLVSALYIANYVWHDVHDMYIPEKKDPELEKPWWERELDSDKSEEEEPIWG